jgi:hypothetical protein
VDAVIQCERRLQTGIDDENDRNLDIVQKLYDGIRAGSSDKLNHFMDLAISAVKLPRGNPEVLQMQPRIAPNTRKGSGPVRNYLATRVLHYCFKLVRIYRGVSASSSSMNSRS